MATTSLENASFRDRTNRVFYCDGSVYRGLRGKAVEDWKALSATCFFRKHMAEGKIANTQQVSPPETLPDSIKRQYDIFLKHEKVSFISYPYEWCFGMLKDAALLQLDLLSSALDEGMILKDSSAFNIQWHGSQPVFIDIPSFEPYQSGSPWVGYRQFCQMFLYPLFLQAHKEIPFQPWFRGDIEGMTPSDFAKFLSFRDLFRRGAFTHGYLHAKIESRYASTTRNVQKDLRSAGFRIEMVKANIGGLRKLISRLSWRKQDSAWIDYTEDNSYTDEDVDAKLDFVRDVCSLNRWNVVWDLGCNTGAFSAIAADSGSSVVAVDADHLSVERLYDKLKANRVTSTLPLVMNLANPSPSLGWRCQERVTLDQRGKPDLILALALIHHMVITANIPMEEFVNWLAQLGASLVIEFVSKEDPMVKVLLRHRVDQYTEYDIETFERALQKHYDIEKRVKLKSGTRMLFFAKKHQ